MARFIDCASHRGSLAEVDTPEELRISREQIAALLETYSDGAELKELGDTAIKAIAVWEEQTTQSKHETYEDEDAWETRLAGQLQTINAWARRRQIDHVRLPTTN